LGQTRQSRPHRRDLEAGELIHQASQIPASLGSGIQIGSHSSIPFLEGF
jgi:hypothetical protein